MFPFVDTDPYNLDEFLASRPAAKGTDAGQKSAQMNSGQSQETAAIIQFPQAA